MSALGPAVLFARQQKRSRSTAWPDSRCAAMRVGLAYHRGVAQSQPIIDAWSAVHFASGVGMALVGLRASEALIASVAWEVLENTVAEAPGIKEVIPSAGAESLENALFDIVVNMTGYGVTRLVIDRLDRD